MSALDFRPATDGPLPLAAFDGVSLADLNARAALLDRMENKYLVDDGFVRDVLPAFQAHFDVLRIGGRNTFGYESVYFDSDSLVAYHAHVQGRRRRFKIRTRRYVESDEHYVEIKLKGRRGSTIKRRMPIASHEHGALTPKARRFVADTFRSTYDIDFAHGLRPTLAVRYRRLTFVGKDFSERMTFDYDLRFAGSNGRIATPPSGLVIVETKTRRGRGMADRLMRAHGVRSGPCSKYGVGLNLVRAGLRYNRFKPVLSRHLGWQPPHRVAA